MAADIEYRHDLFDRLPRLVAYALHHNAFFPTLRAADQLESDAVRKVLLKGLTLYARESAWSDQVDFVVERLIGRDNPVVAHIRDLVLKAKTSPPGPERKDAQKSLVRTARLTEQARPFQLAVLRDMGWDETARWLAKQPYPSTRGRGVALYSPDQIKALNLPRTDLRPTSRINVRRAAKKPTTDSARNKLVASVSAPAEQNAVPVRPSAPLAAPTIRDAGGGLVVFNKAIFANIKHRVETSNWRVLSADTYFLAEALSVHQRWVIYFPEKLRISTSAVINRIEIRVQQKGLVADLWHDSVSVDRVNFQRSLIRSQTPIAEGSKQSVGLVLLYIFNTKRTLKKSNLAEDEALARKVASSHFPVSSVYRIKTASSLADIGVHSRVRGNSTGSEQKRHDVRGHTRRVRGVDYRVKAHQRGV